MKTPDGPSYTDKVLMFLVSRPGQWVKADVLMLLGGKHAWRTRVSDARIQLQQGNQGTIENRQSRMLNDEHETICVVSEYRFVPTPVVADQAHAGRLF